MKQWIILLLVAADLVVNIDNNRKIRQSMADNKAAFDQVLQQLNEATNDVSNELDDLKAQIQGNGLGADDEADVLSKLDALSTRLKGLAANPDQPVPPTE